MAYGLSTRVFVEDGPLGQLSKVEANRSPVRSWRALNEACRLEVVEQALRAAS